jgi:hypothetical protein
MAETQGVLYLNQNQKCIVRLLVSVFSLRKHYSGPISLIAVGDQPKWFTDKIKTMNVDIVPVHTDMHIPALVRKARLHEYSPYDVSMFIDADTLIVAPIDEYFDKIREYKFCTGEFAGWKTSGGTMSRRIKSFSPVVPDYVEPALNYGKATNTGIFGFTKDSPVLEEWKWIAEEGWLNGCSRIPDEVGCQMLLHKYKHWLAPVEWGTSVKYGDTGKNLKIVHYHGRKHVHPLPLCNLWKQAYWELYYSFPSETDRKLFTKPHGDRRLGRYLKSIGSNVTVVTAVNSKYLKKLKANFPKWLKTEGIYEHPIKCFVHGIDLDSPDLDFMRDRVELIEWDFPKAHNMRERMLSAFVFGAAKEVKTKWWIKLDCDTTPKDECFSDFTYKLDMPKEAWDKDIAGHRCGYTKSKQGYKDKHFLNLLDEWWHEKTGKAPIFPENIPLKERHGHKRIASFICLQKTKFTRKCAALCSDTGVLPVPSQDTFAWYVCERTSKKWLRCNFKKRFSP